MHGDTQAIGQPHTFAWNDFIERLAIDELHHDVMSAVLLGDVVYADDIGVIQRGGGAGFVHEAGAAVRIGEAGFGEEFDGDEAVETRIPRFIDHAHAAFSELFKQRERSEVGRVHIGL